AAQRLGHAGRDPPVLRAAAGHAAYLDLGVAVAGPDPPASPVGVQVEQRAGGRYRLVAHLLGSLLADPLALLAQLLGLLVDALGRLQAHPLAFDAEALRLPGEVGGGNRRERGAEEPGGADHSAQHRYCCTHPPPTSTRAKLVGWTPRNSFTCAAPATTWRARRSRRATRGSRPDRAGTEKRRCPAPE